MMERKVVSRTKLLEQLDQPRQADTGGTARRIGRTSSGLPRAGRFKCVTPSPLMLAARNQTSVQHFHDASRTFMKNKRRNSLTFVLRYVSEPSWIE
ncbi:hypothetical protein ATANTOWER_032463 [Ataeniobius toweri]|uniref:Uncharacterized protein n=1 Tax=Ataeniobius toweri TaxID=208326 RepID=A0ABU7A3D6_9TELE|nr:hypothetical protein [Ataeniobius toweri]